MTIRDEHIHACIAPETGALLMQFELGKLSANERERFERHLFDCDFCLAESSAMRHTADAMIANRAELIEAFAKDKVTVESLLDQAVGKPLIQSSDTFAKPIAAPPPFAPWKNIFSPRAAVAYACAAAIMLVIGLGVFDRQAPIEIAAYAPPTWLSWQSRSATSSDSLLISAQVSYTAKDYASAASSLTEFLANHKDAQEPALYLAVSQYELGQYQQAESTLARLLTWSSVINDEAMFYRALIHIKKGDNNEAMKILQQIMNEKSTHMDDARDLMAKIKTPKG